MTESTILRNYNSYIRRKAAYIWIMVAAILVFSVAGLLIGPSKTGFSDLVDVLLGRGGESHRHILLNLRLPRIIAAITGGIALAVSGAVMQTILRNPLASPFTLGISNAAAFGAAFAVIVFGAGKTYSNVADSVVVNNPYLVTASAFVWSLAASFLILFVARKRGATPENMVLTGIIASSLFTALTTGLQFIADDVQLAAIVFWTFGDLSKGGWDILLIQAVIIIPSVIYFMFNRWNYNALDSGDEAAISLGANIKVLRINGMIIASAATAVVVSFYGMIAFVGLVVPHIVRRLIGSNERFLLPASALTGAAFLLGCDILARTIISPVVLPVGILTSIIGAPLFIVLLLGGVGLSQWK